jgi:3-hydroxyisobutyrate dehydrogenase
MPILHAMGDNVICLGTRGAGSVMKLAVNSMIHNINQSLAEAMTLAETAGIDAKAAFSTIEASAACAPMLKYRRALYLDEAGQDVTFTVALARKDMEITVDLARQLGIATPQGQATLDQLRCAGFKGFDSRDMASMLTYMREGNQ